MLRASLLLVCVTLPGFAAAQDGGRTCVLREGDVVALCGDSITSDGYYPLFLEAYQLVCGPRLKVGYVNCGRWGEVARDFPKTWDRDFLSAKPTVLTVCYGMNIGRGGRVLSPAALADEAKALKTILERFKANGGRVVVLGSPGCVDTTFHPNHEAANASLAQLRDNARDLAKETGVTFVDVYTPMRTVMAKAQAKYGPNFAFAGGKGDGLHPGQAGHLVMAWAFLKGLGCDGDIGKITLDKNEGRAEGGHRVLGFKDGVLTLESERYPFCFVTDLQRPNEPLNSNATRSVADLFPFNDDLNRLTLIVRDPPAKKVRVTWGTQSKEFAAADLERGINLAAEFLDNPFAKPFGQIMFALRERNSCRRWLTQKEFKDSPSIQKRLEKAIETLNPKPVRHEIRIEAIADTPK